MIWIAGCKADASTETGNRRQKSKETPLSSSKRGSILIGIIITMVVMAFLGAGMLSLTTTSTFHELLFGNNAGAASAAESGGRYAMAVIRDAYATDLTKLNAINAGQTFNLGNGSTFQIINWMPNGANPATINFTSVGTVGSGFLEAKRQIRYGIQPANQAAAGGGGAPPGYGEGTIDLATLPANVTSGSMGFTLLNPGGDQAIGVTKEQGGEYAEAYVFAPMAFPNPFWLNWNAAGGYSSYDLQAKIATGTLTGTTLSNPPTTYANGITFRSINQGGQKQDFLGVSLVRNGSLVPPNTTVEEPPGTTPWQRNIPYNIDDYVSLEGAYYRCTVAHTSRNTFSRDAEKWASLSNADKSMIVFWRRDSNQANGDGTWLAYKMLNDTSHIFDASGHTIDWSTLMVRLIEAASVKLTENSAPLINVGDTIAGTTGTARVFRKINDSDGKVVLLLNIVIGEFVRPTTIGTYSTDASWGYRSRDNYIWVFYTDRTDHSSNEFPQDNTRLGQLRGTKNWPVTDVPAWTAEEDKYSLVSWNSQLNTNLLTQYPGKTIRIMGSGKEQGAIIRTDLFTRPGPYPSSADFPGEIGLVSLGGANNAYFDDFAFFLRGGFSGGAAADGSGSVIQYP